jgi:hypothetical protein
LGVTLHTLGLQAHLFSLQSQLLKLVWEHGLCPTLSRLTPTNILCCRGNTSDGFQELELHHLLPFILIEESIYESCRACM